MVVEAKAKLAKGDKKGASLSVLCVYFLVPTDRFLHYTLTMLSSFRSIICNEAEETIRGGN